MGAKAGLNARRASETGRGGYMPYWTREKFFIALSRDNPASCISYLEGKTKSNVAAYLNQLGPQHKQYYVGYQKLEIIGKYEYLLPQTNKQ